MNKGKSPRSTADTWFQVFRAAQKSGDRELQSLAKRELKNLGYDVMVRRNDSPKRQEAAQ